MTEQSRTGAAPEGPRLLRARRALRALGIVLVCALLAAGLIRAVGVQSFGIPSASMEPTLPVGGTVTVWRPDALADSVDRGDVVVFDGRGSFIASAPPSGAEQLGSWFGVGPRDVYYVKRILAVGGDTLECCDAEGRLLLNGEPLEEPYVPHGMRASDTDFAIEVPAGRVWMMGDNRADSTDSRALLGGPGGGMIPVDRILGTVIGHGSAVDSVIG
ncbi:signal peptidase I [Brevibacterium pityocampae]|uniref:Signal peptidase I n=1 Tax=Brevibacterium pityocampae TaxID=506594 RepID=A0ABP8JTE8_9MICO